MALNALTASTELHVRPKEWESFRDSEQLPLSLMGHIMPKIYVLIAEVFALPDDADPEGIISSMTVGLEYSLSQFPILTGSLEMDATSGRMWVSKKKDSAVSLHVKHIGHEFPSYDELEKKDFPANLISGPKLLPESVTAKQLFSPLGDNNEEGIPIATFQISFIQGGLILGVAIHHALSDGPGCDGFLTSWAENSNAAAQGTPFIPAKEPFRLQGSPLDVATPSAEDAQKLENAYPAVKDAGGPMPAPPPGFQMPPLACQMFHFPKSKVDGLKQKLSEQVDNGWISTYDAIMAVLWSSVTRAKMDLLKPSLDDKNILIHAVDTRKTWNPPLPERFLGVGACGARCESTTIKDLIDPSNLPIIATSVRTSIIALTPTYLSGLLQWVASRSDKRYLEFNLNSFLGMDFGASSWAGMTAYEKHDFGFGWPKALRWPSPPFDGFAFVYPSRAKMKYASEDEGVEVCVCLEEGCMKRLIEDEVMSIYANPRG